MTSKILNIKLISKPFERFNFFSTVNVNNISNDLLLNSAMGHGIGGRNMKELVKSLERNHFIKSSLVSDAMQVIDRRIFVEHFCVRHLHVDAYENKPLSIGFSATISTPQQHATILELLVPYLKPGSKVLDIGSGSAYLTMAFGALVGDKGSVYGLEHIPELIEKSRTMRETTFKDIVYADINFVTGDGYLGLKSHGPYDAIHVGASLTSDKDLVELSNQITVGGCIVAPLGPAGGEQRLTRVVKDSDGALSGEVIQTVFCTPMQTRETQLNSMKAPETNSDKRAKLQVQLEAWKNIFELEHKRKPTRDDMFIDKTASDIFKQFTSIKNNQPWYVDQYDSLPKIPTKK